MEKLSLEEWMKQYHYLMNVSKGILIIPKDTYELYCTSSKVRVGNKSISINLLKDILEVPEFYLYLEQILEQKGIFKYNWFLGENASGIREFNVVEIVKGIESLIKDNKDSFSKDFTQKYEKLSYSVSFENLLKKYKNINYDINLDNENFSIPVLEIINFMKFSDEKFDNICTSKDIKAINNIPKEKFIYACYNFVRENISKCIFPKDIISRYDEIKKFQKIDIQAVNKILVTKDRNLENIRINEELRNAIITDMPSDISDLEKACYIYIKMCKILTYATDFYALNQRGNIAKKHEDINNVSLITPENNKVVCYEFNSIFGKFLEEIGINFVTTEAKREGFGGGHTYLEFRCGKYLVSADSVTSIFNGDLTAAKLNQPIKGLKCLNRNCATNLEFREILDNVYKIILKQENKDEIVPVVHVQKFDEILKEYSILTTNLSEVDLEEKIDILISKLSKSKTEGIDTLSYILQLRKILFTEKERKNNFKVTVVRDNEKYSDEFSVTASCVFALNKFGFLEKEEETLYYLYDSNKGLVQINKQELEEKFNKETFQYVEPDDPIIPGIIQGKGSKK